jgi:hypothetical protein
MEMREFSKNDWDAYAGAERPSKTQQPLIGEIKVARHPGRIATVAVDKNGVFIYVLDDDGQELVSIMMDTSFIAGKAYAQHILVDEIDIKVLMNEHGFEDCNSDPNWLHNEIS